MPDLQNNFLQLRPKWAKTNRLGQITHPNRLIYYFSLFYGR